MAPKMSHSGNSNSPPSGGDAAQALNGQHPELTYADADTDEEDLELDSQQEQERLEKRQLLARSMDRKQSLGERRNVELTLLKVVDEKDAPSKPSPAEPPSPDKFAPGLRRNSISLPSGINALDLEALRLRHQMQPQDALDEEIVSTHTHTHIYSD